VDAILTEWLGGNQLGKMLKLARKFDREEENPNKLKKWLDKHQATQQEDASDRTMTITWSKLPLDKNAMVTKRKNIQMLTCIKLTSTSIGKNPLRMIKKLICIIGNKNHTTIKMRKK